MFYEHLQLLNSKTLRFKVFVVVKITVIVALCFMDFLFYFCQAENGCLR